MTFFSKALAFVACSLFLVGCATNKIDWASRVGNYTYDQAVLEMGPPDKLATLTDGTKVAEWLTARGQRMGGHMWVSRRGYVHSTPDWEGPDYFIRLSFDPEGRLTGWRKVAK